MIQVVRVCAVAGILVVAAADGRAAPATKSSERTPRPGAGLSSPDPAVRREAITKLVTDRDATAVAQLALTLEGDDDEAVREAAASGLGDLADKRGIGALKRCLQQEPSQQVKRSCRVALARLDPSAGTASPEPTSAAPAATASAPAASSSTPAVSSSTPAAGSQFELRIDLTAQDVAERPNHVYLELWSALDKNTLSLGYERVLAPRWTVAVESQFFAESESSNGAKASAVAAAVAVRPHFYFLQQAPSGPYIAPFGSVGYSRVTFDFPDGFPQGDDKITGTVWAIGAGVGWSVVINARAVLKVSAVFSYAKAAASFGTSGVEQSSSSASFNPFVSAGILF
ncbi:MAG TPA: HEAT repeat domain-containing protein [Kofleriaceae bacterium]|nr:HEAT repeat domain-containing protein [Kofleriaceae bacterium]